MAINNYDFVVKHGLVVSTTATIRSTTNSVDTGTGALHVAGGASIVQDLWVGGRVYTSGGVVLTTSTLQTVTQSGNTTTYNIKILNTDISTGTTTGALTVAGGVGIGGDVYVGGTIFGTIGGNNVSGSVGGSINSDNVLINNVNTASTASYYITLSELKDGSYSSLDADSALTYDAINQKLFADNVNVVKDLYVGGTLYTSGGVVLTTATLQTVTQSGNTTTYSIKLLNTDRSTGTATGALTVAGGVGIGGDVYVGGGMLTGSARTTNNVSVGGSVSINGSSATISILGFNGVSFLTDSVHAFSGGEIVVPQTSGLGLVSGTTYYVPAVLSPTRFQLSLTPGGASVGTVGVSTILANTGPGPGLKVTGGIESTGTNTGAVIVKGGVGISGNLNVGGRIIGGGVRTTTTSTAPQNPVVGDIWYNTTNDAVYRYTNDGSGEIYWIDMTGPAVVNFTADMLAGISANGGVSTNAGNILVNNAQPGNIYYIALAENKDGNYSPIDADSVLTYNSTDHQVSTESLAVTGNTVASSTTTGALTVAGGVGIGGALYVGGLTNNTSSYIVYYDISTGELGYGANSGGGGGGGGGGNLDFGTFSDPVGFTLDLGSF
jgi:hypothetical protein